jgi:SOS-response transcriptional repressor LexA
MNSLGDRLKQSLEKADLTQVELAEKLGVSQQAVQFICSGRTKHSKHIGKIAEILNVTPEWLMFGSNNEVKEDTLNYASIYKVPLYTIRELDTDQSPTRSVLCPFDHNKNTFALLIEGEPNSANAMHPSFGRAYPVGSIVFADPEQSNRCKNGDVVIAELTNRPNKVTTFRQLYMEGGTELLIPLNPQFPPVAEPFKVTAKIIGAILP